LCLCAILLNTLAHQVDEEGVATVDFTLDLIATDIWIGNSRVEGDLQVEVGVGVHVALAWLNSEMLAISLSIPRELGLDVTEIAQL